MSIAYLYIFLQSNLLEIPFYFLFIKKKQKFLASAALVTAINSLTHPIVFFVIMNSKNSYLQNIIFAEVFAILVETIFFSKIVQLNLRNAFFEGGGF